MIFVWLLLFLSAIFNVVLGYYLYKFARIILSIEDLLSDTLTSLDALKNSVTQITNFKFFFDSPEVKVPLDAMVEELRLSEFVISRLIQNFTNLSQNKYVFTRSEENNEEKD